MNQLPIRQRDAQRPPFALPPDIEWTRTSRTEFGLIGQATLLDQILDRARRSGVLFAATPQQPYGDGRRSLVNVRLIELQRAVRAPEKAWLRRRWKPALATVGPLATAAASVVWIFRAAILAAIETAVIAAVMTVAALLLIGVGRALTSSSNRGHCSGPNSGH